MLRNYCSDQKNQAAEAHKLEGRHYIARLEIEVQKPKRKVNRMLKN